MFGQGALSFIRELGRCLWVTNGEPQSHHFLRLRIAVALQRGNIATALGTMRVDGDFFNL